MPAVNDARDGKDDTASTENSGFDSSFNSGKDAAASAENAARAINKDIPGADDGAWDDSDESVTGSVSGFMRNEEGQRDPFGFRQIPHEFLHLNNSFLTPHFQKFQAAATEQLKVIKDPKSTADIASSTMNEAYKNVKVEIDEKDQPKISEDAERLLKGVYPRAEEAVLVASGFGHAARGVALDPSHDKAYVVTESGDLYGVALPGGAHRKLVTSDRLGYACGVALDGHGYAYVTDRDGKRLLRVDLSTGDTTTIVTDVQAYGIGLDGKGKAYITDQDKGQLIEVRLEEEHGIRVIAEGLKPSTSGVALDGKGKAYTGHWNDDGALWEVDLANRTSRPVPPAGTSFPWHSCGIALDGEGTAYASDHARDCLYKVRLDTGAQALAVKSRSGNFSALGVALDSDNGVVYVSTWEGQLWQFSLRVLQSAELIEVTTGV
jgi:DNA-binding beta-propeller fold protein YncE